ncbi:MAG: aspartate--ammonia ligase, partial [Acetivibrio sp.]
MNPIIMPEKYSSKLNIRETEVAIKYVKDFFERELANQLNLTRVSAPLFVVPESGLNDTLNGVERPVSFGIKEQNDREAEIVHSLAKWKRQALKR